MHEGAATCIREGRLPNGGPRNRIRRSERTLRLGPSPFPLAAACLAAPEPHPIAVMPQAPGRLVVCVPSPCCRAADPNLNLLNPGRTHSQ
jgi:hypothetical protein